MPTAAKAGGVCVGLIVAAGFAILTLNIFYRHGAPLLDAGWFAWLSAASDASLTDPAAIDGRGFFHVHVMPIFEATNLLARLLPLRPPQFFALLLGCAHAATAMACWRLLVDRFRLAGGVAALLALAYGFTGLAVAMALYPHPEIMIAATIVVFLTDVRTARPRLALVAFIGALATREDAGLHLFAFLLALFVADRTARTRTLVAYAAMALGWAVLAIIAQRTIWPDGSPFGRVYLGAPVYGHVSLGVLAERLGGLLAYRSYIAAPALVAILWAWVARRPEILLGYAALLPWTVLHLCAASPLAATFTGYYGFPYLVAMLWPLIVLDARDRVARPALGFALMLLAGVALPPLLYNPSNADLPRDLVWPPSSARQNAMTEAAQAVADARPALGHLLVADAMVALAPDRFTPDNTIPHATPGAFDSVVLIDRGLGAAELEQAAACLPDRWHLRGTMFSIATNRPRASLPGLVALADAD